MNLALFYILCISVISLYIFLILFLNFYWKKTNIPEVVLSEEDFPFISIIIVGRNEASNLKDCIESIAANDYPDEMYEIIYIDDNSEDDSLEILKSLEISNLSYFELDKIAGFPVSKNHKKQAIKYGILRAKAEIILLTDADTVTEKNWIKSHAGLYVGNQKIELITAPVLFQEESGLLNRFQFYDLLTTMGITAAGITSGLFYMANGANMSYRKTAFLSTGYSDNYASGDDMFLIQNIAEKNKKNVLFLKDKKAIATTKTEKTIKDFILQRLRWASKTGGYKDRNLQMLVAFVFIVNFIVLINFLAVFFVGISQLIFAIVLLLIKIFADSYFIFNISKFFNKKIYCRYLFFSLLLYPVYYTFTGLSAIFTTKYNWKGRKVR